MKKTVFIDGESGTTGLLLKDRLENHPEVALLPVDPDRRRDPEWRKGMIRKADFAFLCLPDDAARESVRLAEGSDCRIIDATTAHRCADGWIYGIPELKNRREEIRAAKQVSVPGCHATGFVMLIAPLVECGLIDRRTAFSCQSLTGYSGGGKQMIAEYESGGDGSASVRPYALHLDHKHIPEMMKHTGIFRTPLFVPVVGNYKRGIVLTAPLPNPIRGCNASRIRDALADYYREERFVNILPEEPPAFFDPRELNGTNAIELGAYGSEDGRILLVARLDNLGKGASGAAVQCLNVMLGVDEETALQPGFESG